MMDWRKRSKEEKYRRYIIDRRFEMLEKAIAPPAAGWRRAETVEEYLRRGGTIKRLPPR